MGLMDIFFPRPAGPSILDVVKFIDAVTSDPETDGKKDGYERAANEYEPIYQGLKREYDNAISEIQRQKRNYYDEGEAPIEYLAQLEKKREDLQERFNYKAKQTAETHGVSVPFLMSSFSGTNIVRDTGWDIMKCITDSRMRKRKEAEKAGYSEAKRLYERKLKLLCDKLEQEKANADRWLRDYIDLIAAVLEEIEDNQMKIADLEIALQED